jgi:exosortase
LNLPALLFAPLLGWITLFAQARYHWGENSYYAYGWSIPFLAILLGLRRLQNVSQPSHPAPSSRGAFSALFLFLILLIPLRLVAEPDPYWRLPLWLQAIILIMVTLLALRLLFGQSAWRNFLFPCLFTLTALPWPTFAESVLVHTLTGWVTSIDAEILLLCGQPAEVVENIIQVAGERIEIDATCSGIRSFQCLLAFGLFFGEYFRLPWLARCLVACAGLFFALGFNLVRALTLSFLSLESDVEIYDSWHDPVGHLAVALAFLSLFLFALWIKGFRGIAKNSKHPLTFSPAPPVLSGLACFLSILPEAATQGWFRFGVTERNIPEWSVEWAAVKEDKLNFIPFRKTTVDILLFDHGKRALIEMKNGSLAEIFYYEYDGSRPAPSICSRHHNPSVCMAATAAHLAGGNETSYLSVGSAKLRFTQYVAGKPDYVGQYPIHAFWCPWTPDSRSGAIHFQDLPRSDRIANFLTGRIDYARKVLLVVLHGNQTMKQAETNMKSLLGEILRPKQ